MSKKCAIAKRPSIPGVHAFARKKFTEYGGQLREKQKTKRAYGVSEKQFRGYYHKAARGKGQTGEVLLQQLERRLDNVVYRMGIAASRPQARQMVNHGHITVNGRRVNIASYLVRVGEIIAIKPEKQKLQMYKDLRDARVTMPKWLTFDFNKLTGHIIELPGRDDIDLNIREQLIVELYSR